MIAITERLSASPSRLRIAPVLELLQILFVSILCCSPGQVGLDNSPMDLLFVEFLVLCYSELTKIEVCPGKDSGFETSRLLMLFFGLLALSPFWQELVSFFPQNPSSDRREVSSSRTHGTFLLEFVFLLSNQLVCLFS